MFYQQQHHQPACLRGIAQIVRAIIVCTMIFGAGIASVRAAAGFSVDMEERFPASVSAGALPPPTSAETLDWELQVGGANNVAQADAQEFWSGVQYDEYGAPFYKSWGGCGIDSTPFSWPDVGANEPWTWRILPEGLFYHSYLAGTKEARLAAEFTDQDEFGTLLDSTLGARVGIVRYGNTNAYDPHGWQLDVEAAALLRQDYDHNLDVMATDFRVGVPLTYARGRYRMKFGWYHLSSHLGDEYMVRTGATRINYSRDVIVWGHSYYLMRDLRIYGEAGYAFYIDDGAEPWEFQFGIEWAPTAPTGPAGAPFVALNAHLREEVNFGGNFVAQAGWAWRSSPTGGLLRIGVDYYNGKSRQFSFFNTFEQQIGAGIWYDF